MKYKNAFSALGLDPDVATIDTLRTDIALALARYIELTGISQEKAGELFGVKQSVVSQIARGDVAHLSVERLIRAMVRAKIQGFAEWGESSEDARAGTGYRPAATSVTVIHTRNFDVPGITWSDAKPANAGRTAPQVIKSKGVPEARMNKVN